MALLWNRWRFCEERNQMMELWNWQTLLQFYVMFVPKTLSLIITCIVAPCRALKFRMPALRMGAKSETWDVFCNCNIKQMRLYYHSERIAQSEEHRVFSIGPSCHTVAFICWSGSSTAKFAGGTTGDAKDQLSCCDLQPCPKWTALECHAMKYNKFPHARSWGAGWGCQGMCCLRVGPWC